MVQRDLEKEGKGKTYIWKNKGTKTQRDERSVYGGRRRMERI